MKHSAYDYGLNLLTARAYTVRNLRRKFSQKGFAPDDADAAVERLVAAGLMDDTKFAHEFARQKLLSGVPARRVRQLLIARGISDSVASSAIDSVLGEEEIDFGKSIERVARKKLASMAGVDPQVQRRRLFEFLSRRGFDPSDVQRALYTSMGSTED